MHGRFPYPKFFIRGSAQFSTANSNLAAAHFLLAICNLESSTGLQFLMPVIVTPELTACAAGCECVLLGTLARERQHFDLFKFKHSKDNQKQILREHVTTNDIMVPYPLSQENKSVRAPLLVLHSASKKLVHDFEEQF